MNPGHVVPKVDQLDLALLHPQVFQGLLEFFMQQAAFTTGHDETVEAFFAGDLLDAVQAGAQAGKG